MRVIKGGDFMADEMKRRGRKPLPPDVKALHQAEKRLRDKERRRATGYAYDRLYKQRNREKVNAQARERARKKGAYKITLMYPAASKPIIQALSLESGLSLSALFAEAIKERFGVDILDNKKE